MSSQISLKQEAKKLMKIKGNIRGEGILTDVEYVRYRKGEKGVELVEKKLKELSCPLKFKEIQPMGWYPAGLDVLNILVIKEILNWTDKDIFNMGNFAAKVSFLVRMLMKYFISAKKSFEESPKYWSKNFDFGKLEAYEFNEKKKYMTFRLRDYRTHPIMCIDLAGYFLQMARYVVKSEKITIEETKCLFKGDPYHEYLIKWK